MSIDSRKVGIGQSRLGHRSDIFGNAVGPRDHDDVHLPVAFGRKLDVGRIDRQLIAGAWPQLVSATASVVVSPTSSKQIVLGVRFMKASLGWSETVGAGGRSIGKIRGDSFMASGVRTKPSALLPQLFQSSETLFGRRRGSSRNGRRGSDGGCSRGQRSVDPQFAGSQRVGDRLPFGRDHCPANHGFVAARRRIGRRLHLKDELCRVLRDLRGSAVTSLGMPSNSTLAVPGKSFFFSTLITSSVVCPCSTAAA